MHDDNQGHSHTHGTGVRLSAEQQGILAAGLEKLLAESAGCETVKPLPSERYPSPLCLAVYGRVPPVSAIRADVRKARAEPLTGLEQALALVEAIESNRPESAGLFPDDMAFKWDVFSSKWVHGWCHILGGDEARRLAVAEAVKARWQFTFWPSPEPYRPTGAYVLLERLARNAFAIGRCKPGDPHQMCHYIEEYTPGVLVCLEPLGDLELTLSLAIMKLGVPAVVPQSYPLDLGRTLRVDLEDQIPEAVVGFANTRRLLGHPALPGYPAYCIQQKPEKEPEASRTYGNAAGGFYLFRKASVASPGATVDAASVEVTPDTPFAIVAEAEGEPLDAIDCDYIEKSLARHLWRLEGHRAELSGGRLVVGVAAGASFDLQRLAEVLLAGLRNDFPKLDRSAVRIYAGNDAIVRSGLSAEAAATFRKQRLAEIRGVTEENQPCFYGCTGCSPFAPDHVCVLTVERVPQCNRPYGMIKTGAHYGYDDGWIHHSKLHRDLNSFFTIDKGECIDPLAGEWSGVNAHAARETAGRTSRIQLHSLGDAPTTGCGCFHFIMFRTDQPRPGVAIMHAGWEGKAPDGRRWSDLHYELGGKQAPGVSGCSAGYFSSKKFLQAEGGWKSVVWVTGKVAAIAAKRLAADATVSE